METVNNSLELSSKIGREILISSRNEMMVAMRFLDVALSTFNYYPDLKINSVSTDGQMIRYNTTFLIEQYKRSRNQINRLTMHILFHSLFRHMFKIYNYDPVIWNLATDIAVGFTLDSISLQQLAGQDLSKRQTVYSELQKSVKFMTAEHLYYKLKQDSLTEKKLVEWALLFWHDDHLLWYPEHQDETASGAGQENSDNGQTGGSDGSDDDSKSLSASSLSTRADLSLHWSDVAGKMQVDLETFSKEMGNSAGNLAQYVKIENRDRYDYGKFLKKFAVLREEIKIDDEEFDYIAYTFGLSLHKNLPFIEPLEYKDVRKIEEFVIAIDTSGSTSGVLVRNFLNKTYSILLSTENFFKRVDVHIIQCDTEIQEDHKVTNLEDFKAYIDKYEVKGLGGTDFRPVFTYVDSLLKKKEFTNLKGLIYFTDGYGTYPRDPTPYDTAFVFIRDDYTDVDVPGWAIKLVLEPDDLA